MDEDLKQFLLGMEERLTAELHACGESIAKKIGSLDGRSVASEDSLYSVLHKHIQAISDKLDHMLASMEETEAILNALPDDAFSIDKLPDWRDDTDDGTL